MSRSHRIQIARCFHNSFFLPLVLLSLGWMHPGIAAQFHVTTSGSASGSGSSAEPWSLAHALSHPSQVAAGDTIWIHEGAYPGSFVSYLLGTVSRPIVVRNYEAGRATLEDRTGGSLILDIRGGYTWYWGLEVRSISTNLTNTSGVVIYAPGIKCINMVVHDCLSSGISPFKDAIDAEVYGSLIYYNGRQTQKYGGAYGTYIQNVTGRKLIRDNIYHHNWSYGIHAYEGGGADLDNMTFEGNAIFNNGLFYEANKFRTNVFVGGDHTADNNVFRNNYTYYSPEPAMNQANVIGSVTGATNLTMEGNFWVSPGYYAMNLNTTGSTIRGNVFLGRLDGLSAGTYPENSFYTSLPTRTDDIFVRPNAYEAGRGHVYAYNWDQSGSVLVDVSPILRPGDRFEIRDALDYYGPSVLSGTYAGGTISIPMTGLSTATPEGNPVAAPIHTAPRFGAFVVVSLSQAASFPVGSIDVEPDTLSSLGGDVTVSWVSSGATSASISPGLGAVAVTGSAVVPVSQTTTFTLALSNPSGTSTYQATAVVRQPPPAAPALLEPANDMSNQATSVTFRWNAVPNATSYQIQSSPDGSFGTLSMDAVANGDATHSVTDLQNGTTYYWRVRSRGTGGESGWSDAWSFSTAPITKSSLPVNLQGTPPEEQLIEIQLQKPVMADSVVVTMWTYDADASNEGTLTINGNLPLPLFGAQAQNTFDKTSVPVTFVLSSSLFQNGTNRLLFGHTSTAGFRIDTFAVEFRPTTDAGPGANVPISTALEQNFPNPFNPTTVIPFVLAKSSHVELAVFDILGERVATLIDGPLGPGRHSARFSAPQISGGVYFYVLRTGDFQETRRMAYVK